MLRGKLEGEINVLREQIKSAKSNEEHFRLRKETVSKEMEEKLRDKETILADKKVIDEQVTEIESETRQGKNCLRFKIG
jgi:chromosome segregation protein